MSHHLISVISRDSLKPRGRAAIRANRKAGAIAGNPVAQTETTLKRRQWARIASSASSTLFKRKALQGVTPTLSRPQGSRVRVRKSLRCLVTRKRSWVSPGLSNDALKRQTLSSYRMKTNTPTSESTSTPLTKKTKVTEKLKRSHE